VLNLLNYNEPITHTAKVIHIGTFRTKIEATKAHNKKASELFGEFACLNDIQTDLSTGFVLYGEKGIKQCNKD